MSWTAINDQVLAILVGVSGIGQTHKFRRLALYSSNNLVNAWEISRTGLESIRRNMTQADPAQTTDTHLFTLYGYYGIADAQSTELTFQQLIDDIVAAFRGNATLNNTAAWSSSVNADTIERREFYDIAVHYAELTLSATEYIDP